MRLASHSVPIVDRRATADADHALSVSLIRNFLIAIKAEGGASSPFMTYAQRRAEWQLEQWGEPLEEFAGASA